MPFLNELFIESCRSKISGVPWLDEEAPAVTKRLNLDNYQSCKRSGNQGRLHGVSYSCPR